MDGEDHVLNGLRSSTPDVFYLVVIKVQLSNVDVGVNHFSADYHFVFLRNIGDQEVQEDDDHKNDLAYPDKPDHIDYHEC